MNETPTTSPKTQREKWRGWIVNGVFMGLCVLLANLGLWQLNRADEKREMLARSAESAAAAAVPISQVTNDIASSAEFYTRVRFTGHWIPEKQLLWDNRIAGGVAGYEVITAFRLTTGEAVLVNRGWVPVGNSRALLPDVSVGVSDSASPLTLEGVVSRPSKGLASGDAVEVSDVWPIRVQYLDYDAFSELFGFPVVPALIQTRAVDEPVTEPWHLLGNWEPTETFGPSRHLGYAFQWFALLATLVFLYVWYKLRWFRAAPLTED